MSIEVFKSVRNYPRSFKTIPKAEKAPKTFHLATKTRSTRPLRPSKPAKPSSAKCFQTVFTMHDPTNQVSLTETLKCTYRMTDLTRASGMNLILEHPLTPQAKTSQHRWTQGQSASKWQPVRHWSWIKISVNCRHSMLCQQRYDSFVATFQGKQWWSW